MRLIHLLLVAAAIGMQAATDEAYLDSMIDDVGASAGRRGGPGSLTTSGSFMMAANRAGNDEDEFGEADEDPPTPQADLAKPVPGLSEEAELGEPVEVDSNELRQKAAVYRQAAEQMEAEADRVAGLDSAASSDYNLSVGADGKAKAAGADADSRTVLSTPALLASCKKSWPFLIKATAQTTHVCVKCQPDAPLAYAIGKHGKHLIWACDATKFKDKELCKKSLKWLGKEVSETGGSAETTCNRLKKLIG